MISRILASSLRRCVPLDINAELFMTDSTTGCLPCSITKSKPSVRTGLTNPLSAATADKERYTSISAICSARRCNLVISAAIVSRSSLNRAYSRSTICSSASRMSVSFSFNSGVTKRSALANVCFRSYRPSGRVDRFDFVTSM
ncbi:hypothetical protein D3C73_817150 [compost metagenome]